MTRARLAEPRRWWRRTGRILRREGNSSFDVRNKVSGTYLYELPFGKDKALVTSGTASHILEGSRFRAVIPLPQRIFDAELCGGNCRCGARHSRLAAPDRVPGVSMTTGGGSLLKWFNTAALRRPPDLMGRLRAIRSSGQGRSRTAWRSRRPCTGRYARMELRATANNVFNTVQYSGVDTNVVSPTLGR